MNSFFPLAYFTLAKQTIIFASFPFCPLFRGFHIPENQMGSNSLRCFNCYLFRRNLLYCSTPNLGKTRQPAPSEEICLEGSLSVAGLTTKNPIYSNSKVYNMYYLKPSKNQVLKRSLYKWSFVKNKS